LVKKGQAVSRGQQIGTIGTNRGMYKAHLHFEIRKNLYIGINRSAFAKDFSNYFRPGQFIAQRRRLPSGGQVASIPINSYKTDSEGMAYPAAANALKSRTQGDKSSTKGKFRVNRFGDIGY
jgi:hypothetical protein